VTAGRDRRLFHVDTTEITHLSLCSGYGGIDLGLKRVLPGLRTVAYAEIEAFAIEVLLARMEGGQLDAAPIWSDLKSFPWEQFSGLVDVLTGGYPCQPFSAAGKRLGTDDERHLWPYIANGIRLLCPRVCFFENVEGHISLGLSTVISDLEELGYRATWGIFSAAEVGAPHQRKRVFIMADRDSKRGQLSNWWKQSTEQMSIGYGTSWRNVWPSRPGEPQHAWEPPRVVVNAAMPRCSGQEQQSESDTRIETRVPLLGAGRESVGDAGRDGRRQDQPWRETEERVTADGTGEGVGESTREPPHGSGTSSGEAGCSEFADSGAVVGNAEQQHDCGQIRTNELSSGQGGLRAHRESTIEADGQQRQAQPALGGDADGPAGGVDYAELCVTCDNRTDELRLLGNGVVPATAEIAFKTLLAEVLQ